jgi:hypothetical protein
MSGGTYGSDITFTGRLGDLAACGSLQHLRLDCVKDVSLDNLLCIAAAPQLREIEVNGCSFDKFLSAEALSSALRASARRGAAVCGLQVEAREERVWPPPCLLDYEDFF